MAGQIVVSVQTVKLIGVGSLAFFATPLNATRLCMKHGL